MKEKNNGPKDSIKQELTIEIRPRFREIDDINNMNNYNNYIKDKNNLNFQKRIPKDSSKSNINK